MDSINEAVKAKERYVILDLSGSDAEDDTISGGRNTPSSDDMNVIKDNKYIVGVKLPSGLTAIGKYAFYGYGSLTSVDIPADVISIGESAFEECDSLASVVIPGTITSIGDNAFNGCSSLANVTFVEGSGITSANFSDDSSLPDDLRSKYLATGGDAGRYTQSSDGYTWTKQQ
jgi:hypothetical protein